MSFFIVLYALTITLVILFGITKGTLLKLERKKLKLTRSDRCALPFILILFVLNSLIQGVRFSFSDPRLTKDFLMFGTIRLPLGIEILTELLVKVESDFTPFEWLQFYNKVIILSVERFEN